MATRHVFPALRGRSGTGDYVVGMMACTEADRLLCYAEEGSVPESWRVERPQRASTIARIVQGLADDQRLPLVGVIACVDKPWRFTPSGRGSLTGMCSIAADARIVAIDGGQALAAMRRMLPTLANQTISVTLLHDPRLRCCQDWHRRLHGIGADDKGDFSDRIARALVSRHPVLKGLVEWNRSALSPRSKAMFTYSAVRSATKELLRDLQVEEQALYNVCSDFWNRLDREFPEWAKVRSGALSAGELRAKWIHSHGVVTQALAKCFRSIAELDRTEHKLGAIDWRRSSLLFEGTALHNGVITKSTRSVNGTASRIMAELGFSAGLLDA